MADQSSPENVYPLRNAPAREKAGDEQKRAGNEPASNPSVKRPSKGNAPNDASSNGARETDKNKQDAAPAADAAPEEDEGTTKLEEKRRFSQAELLLSYTSRTGVEIFDTPTDGAFISYPVGDHIETSAVRSSDFRSWLQYCYHREYYKPPSAQAVEETLRTLEAEARFGNNATQEVHLRVAPGERRIYLDLCNDAWEIVEISRAGWDIRDGSPAYFRRTQGMAALPRPLRGGSLDLLRRFVRVRDDEDFALLCAYLVQSLRPTGPYPILTFTGEQGTGKSTASRMVRSLIDPSPVLLRACPSSEQDLVIAANNGWLMAYDNLDALSPKLSNALCRLSTGGGFGTRRLYANREEEVFAAQRPLLLNGIADILTRPDLRDRALMIELDVIPRKERRTERALWDAFEKAHPYLLGALCDALSTALWRSSEVRLDRLPRMADFARWAVAAEPAFPTPDGTFLRAYRASQSKSVDRVIDADAVASAIVALLNKKESWTGTTKELLSELKAYLPDPANPPTDYPRTYQSMGAHLRRIMPALRAQGIERVNDARARSRAFTLRYAGEQGT